MTDAKRQRIAATTAAVIDTLEPEQVEQLRTLLRSITAAQMDRAIPIFAAGLPMLKLSTIADVLAALIDALALIDERAKGPKN